MPERGVENCPAAPRERSLGVTVWATLGMAGLGGFLFSYPAAQQVLFSPLLLCGLFLGVAVLTLYLVVDIPRAESLTEGEKRKHRRVVGFVGAALLMALATLWGVAWANGGWPHYRTGILLGVVCGGAAGWVFDRTEQ